MLAFTEWEDPSFIIDYHAKSVDALAVLRNVPLQDLARVAPSFSGMTTKEVEEALTEVRGELDLEVSMALCASYEAQLRTDYLCRCQLKKKDSASRTFRDIFKELDVRVSLDILLDTWRGIAGHPEAVGQLKQVFRYRDWLAHGRYWSQKSGIEPDPDDIFDRGAAMTKWLAPHGFPMTFGV